ARGLFESGLCDVVLLGGADTLCELTLYGFSALEAVSPEPCYPFSRNRRGINIGEGSALFLLSIEVRGQVLYGVGESFDAHHVSACEPGGAGARAAMLAALTDAELKPSDISYLNLHGTATPLNDSMESHAVYDIFAQDVSCSSSKPLTGHTLGAAGA